MIVYVIEHKTTYQYKDTSIYVFGESGSGGSGNGGIVIDNLTSILSNVSLSANQGRVLREMIEALQGNFYTNEEIDSMLRILEQKDIELSEQLENISQYVPKKLSELENDLNFITRENLEEELKYVKIPINTSDLINDAGYITEEELENLLANLDLSGMTSGNGKLHIGDEEPEKKDYLWIDTSPKDNKINSKYIEMLDLTTEKLNNLNTKMTTIEENIGKITSSENKDKIKTFRTTLSTIKNEINVLFLQIDNLKSQSLTTLRSEARKTRKATKKLIYSLIDFDDEVMRVLDSELIFDYNGSGGGNNGDNNDDIVVNNASILTEDGVALLTEDGLLILADGIEEVVIPSNAITDESGKLLLTESGLMLLADEIEKSEVFADAILTELGHALMTENGKQILKG
jgi:hypothetical protein